jgi:hypothetical protein
MNIYFCLDDRACKLIFAQELQRSEKLFEYFYSTKFKPEKEGFIIRVNKSNNNSYDFQIVTSKLGVMKVPIPQLPTDYERLRFLVKCFVDFFASNMHIQLFHSSSIVVKQKAYLFIGPSGAGKSTLINLVPRKYRYSDDIAVIKKVGQKYFLLPPIFERTNLGLNKKSYILERIFSLKQAQENEHNLSRRSESRALKKLTKASFKYNLLSYFQKYHLTPQYRETINNTLTLVKNVPVYELSFYKSKNVLDYIIGE